MSQGEVQVINETLQEFAMFGTICVPYREKKSSIPYYDSLQHSLTLSVMKVNTHEFMENLRFAVPIKSHLFQNLAIIKAESWRERINVVAKCDMLINSYTHLCSAETSCRWLSSHSHEGPPGERVFWRPMPVLATLQHAPTYIHTWTAILSNVQG